MKDETRAKKIQDQINLICRKGAPVWTRYRVLDASTQAEHRLTASWTIVVRVDQINYPKNLSPEGLAIWQELNRVASEINLAAQLTAHEKIYTSKINAKTKTGPQKRAAARTQFEIEAGREFLLAYRAATQKSSLSRAHQQISDLQAQQKNLLPQLRRANSTYSVACKRSAADKRVADTEAITSGQFWEASEPALKSYFSPPFEKNYLADVSERWRAALFLQVAHQRGYGLRPTGNYYLCGIDDNGDEWGRRGDLGRLDYGYRSTVDHAVGALFEIDPHALINCQRQGDLLFCPAEIPVEVVLHPQTSPWLVRESHTLNSPGLERNGRFFTSPREITVTHTSHAPIVLPPGGWRLYTTEDAD